MRCPSCDCNLLQKSDGKLKIRVPILVFSADGETCVTSCPRCKEEIPVPVTLAKSALPASEPPKLVLTRGLTRPRSVP
jgi:hypothetical protein